MPEHLDEHHAQRQARRIADLADCGAERGHRAHVFRRCFGDEHRCLGNRDQSESDAHDDGARHHDPTGPALFRDDHQQQAQDAAPEAQPEDLAQPPTMPGKVIADQDRHREQHKQHRELQNGHFQCRTRLGELPQVAGGELDDRLCEVPRDAGEDGSDEQPAREQLDRKRRELAA